MNCPRCHEPELSLLGRSLRFRGEGVEVTLDYLCPRCQTRWERRGETGIKIEEK
jgi:DNA-directed RNA polymerase subunit M/transcription elongation factor TFIIS